MEYIAKAEVLKFFELLNNENILYVLIKNISNELPDKLEDGKDIDILVNSCDIEHFRKVMRDNDYSKVTHPFGRSKGWNFSYQLPECEKWRKNGINYNFLIDVSEKLCCFSLMPKTWIPLDNCINEDIWNNRYFDEENKWWIMDDDTIAIYLIVRSIFDKKEFRSGYIDGIEERKELYVKQSVRMKLSKVFFKFTDRLIQLIMDGRYSDIIDEYLSFMDY